MIRSLKANSNNFRDILSIAYSTADMVNLNSYKKMFNHWYDTYYDTENLETFKKIT